MRLLIIMIMSILLFASISVAAERQFKGGWTWDGDELDIQGFRIKDQDNNIIVNTDALPPSARVGEGIVTVADDGCISLFVVAVDLIGDESGNSNIINYCLPKRKIIRVEGFDINFTEIPN